MATCQQRAAVSAPYSPAFGSNSGSHPSSWTRAARNAVVAGCRVAGALALGGCNASPSQNILGSYFPSWMICALAGVAATIVVRQILVAAGLEKSVPAPLIVYLAMMVAFGFATWLIWLD